VIPASQADKRQRTSDGACGGYVSCCHTFQPFDFVFRSGSLRVSSSAIFSRPSFTASWPYNFFAALDSPDQLLFL